MSTYPGSGTLFYDSACLFQQPDPSANLLATVIVPVKNEAENLYKTLEALRLQEDGFGLPIPPSLYEVLALINNSTDDSFSIATRYQQSFPEFALVVSTIDLPPEDAHIGTVRSLLMDTAYSRLKSVTDNGIIASTDGDTEVDRRWLFHIIEEIKTGNDAVGGRIIANEQNGLPNKYAELSDTYRNLVARVESLLDPMVHDPWPGHFQYYGASFAVTCDMYKRVGGLPRLPYLEDEAFYKVLCQNDAKIRKSPNVKVITSSRLEGRVDIGFSQQLRVWRNMMEINDQQYEEPAENTVTKFRHRKMLRDYWLEYAGHEQVELKGLQSIANELGLDLYWLLNKIESCDYFGLLWQQVEEKALEHDPHKKNRRVVITQAIEELNQFVSAWEGNSFVY